MTSAVPLQSAPWQNAASGENYSESDPIAALQGEREPLWTAEMLFFAVFEGFTCFWIVLVLSGSNSGSDVSVLLPGFFGYCFHLVTQFFEPDVGEVQQTLASMEQAIDEASAQSIMAELRSSRPRIQVLADAYHTVRRSTRNGSSTETVVDHYETDDFYFSSWKDVSGHFDGMGDCSLLSVAVVVGFVFADAETEQSFRDHKARLEGACRPHGRSVRSRHTTSVEHPTFPVSIRRVLVVQKSGQREDLWWMTTRIYDRCRFAWPLCGTVYRVLFRRSFKRVRYDLMKEVSTATA